MRSHGRPAFSLRLLLVSVLISTLASPVHAHPGRWVPAFDMEQHWTDPIAVHLGARLRRGAHGIDALDHPLVSRGAAISLGNVTVYGRGIGPADRLANGHSVAEHERQHAIQSAALGPLCLPLHLVFGLLAWARDGRWHGPSNRLERGPLAAPPRPWA